MPSNFTDLKVTWFDETDSYATSKDITTSVTSMPLFTDTGSGEVNEAQIVLSANFGGFISDKFITTETVIDSYDRIRIEVTDLDGNIYDRFYEVKPGFLPTQTKAEGTLLTLDLVGIEYHTQQIHFNRAFWFKNAFEVSRQIGINYNDNKTALQPFLQFFSTPYSIVSKRGNGFPLSTVNHYEYGLHEDYSYNYWLDMTDKLGGSVDSGGVLDFFDLSFDTPGINTIDFAVFSQGSRSADFGIDTDLPTLVKTDTDNVNVGEQEGGISPGTGTLVASWGAPKRGSLPVGHSKYESGIFQFLFRPVYVNTVDYLIDAKVIDDLGKHWKSIAEPNIGNVPDSSPGFWSQIDMALEFGNTIQYSEWTDDNFQIWVNAGSNHTNIPSLTDGIITYTEANGELAPGMFDCNIVINDNNTSDGEGFFRSWVDGRAINDIDLQDLANIYAYNNDVDEFPAGFRILVDGTSSFSFGLTDPIGIVYTNNIAEYDGKGDWFVKYRPANFGADMDGFQIAVLNEGAIWFWDNSGVVWNLQTGDLAHECFHTYQDIGQAVSFDPKPSETDSTEFPEVTRAGGVFAKNINGAVEVTYDTDGLAITNRVTQGFSDFPANPYMRYGAWLCFRFPTSPSSTGGRSVGDVYGTAVTTPGEIQEPSQLTSQNMDYTSRGNTGYTFPDSEDYGQLNSLAFVMKIDAFHETTVFDGIYECRVCFFDRVDNVVYADFKVPFVGRFFPIDLPLSAFNVYRGRKPVYFGLSGNTLADLKLPKELSIQNQFEWRNIKLVTIHTLLGYDKDGRYFPEAKGGIESQDLDNVTLVKFAGAKITMTIDDFHFTKPLLAISQSDPFDRDLEPEFLERTHISLYDQLLNDARAEVEKQQFEHTQYDIRTSGSQIFDRRFGDGFFFKTNTLTDREDDTDDPGEKNVKLVIRRLEYAITSPGTGSGGLSRRIIASRRFV